jgi:hypothetical protein
MFLTPKLYCSHVCWARYTDCTALMFLSLLSLLLSLLLAVPFLILHPQQVAGPGTSIAGTLLQHA